MLTNSLNQLQDEFKMDLSTGSPGAFGYINTLLRSLRGNGYRIKQEHRRALTQSRRTKAIQRDAVAVLIDCGFGKGHAFVERPEVFQEAPLMAKTFCG